MRDKTSLDCGIFVIFNTLSIGINYRLMYCFDYLKFDLPYSIIVLVFLYPKSFIEPQAALKRQKSLHTAASPVHLFIDFNGSWDCTKMSCNTHVLFNCKCTLCTFESHIPSLWYLCRFSQIYCMSMWHLNM